MIQAQLSVFDAVVLGIMFLSCLFAFFRGFVREVLSLGSWIGAGLVTIYYFQTVAHKLEPQFKNPMAATGIATIGLYALSLLGFSVLNRIIMKFVKSGSDVGILDNFLGLLFGAARGAFIVSLSYLLVVFAIGENARPEWMRGSFTLPYVIQSAGVLARVAPEYMHDISLLQKHATDSVEAEGAAPITLHDSSSSAGSLPSRLIEGTEEETNTDE